MMLNFSRVVALIIAMVIGIGVGIGGCLGVCFLVVDSVTINELEYRGVPLSSDKSFGDNPEVDLRDMSVIDLVKEYQRLQKLEEDVTINVLVKRYDLILHPHIDKLLSREARDLPLSYLLSDEGKNRLLDTLYIGQFEDFICQNPDGTPGNPKDPGTVWIDSDGDVVTGINDVLADFSLYDLLYGDISSDAILETIVLADILGYTWDEANGYWVDSDNVKVTGVMAVFADCTVLTVDEKLNTVRIGELLGYEFNESSSTWLEDDGAGNMVPVHGFMNVVASRTLDTVGDIMDELTIGDIIPEEDRQSGFVSVLDPDTKFDEISDEVNEKFRSMSMRELVESGVVTFDTTAERDNFLASSFADKNISELLTAIANLPTVP